MFKSFINKIEEKYVFNISQFFWHIFVALAAIGIVGGVLLFFWGVIPAFKSSVEKEPYPPMASVSAEELRTALTPPKRAERPAEWQVPTAQSIQPPVSATASIEEIAYRASLDTLQSLIPPAKYSWGADGFYEYPYGPNYPQYRRWVQRAPSVLERLESAFSQSGITSFNEKKQLLDTHIVVVRQFKEEARLPAWKALITWSKPSLSQAIANAKLLASFIPKFSADRSDYFTKLAQFGDKNPNDGYALVDYIGKAIEKFPAERRMDALSALINGYYRYFNNRVQEQIELTNSLLPMLSGFPDDQVVKAVDTYYQLAAQKNYERSQTISAIENRYRQKLMQAEAEYEASKAKKALWRLNGLYGIAGGIVLVATVALILVLLSIQRYVRQIDQRLTNTASANTTN
jgi:hypothetical protein